MLELTNGQIHLWFCFYESIQDINLLTAYRSLLTEDESSRLERFYFAEDRHRFLVTRALVRTVLSRYSPIAPAAWRFCTNSHGKPLIANDDASARMLSFNVSHTKGLILLGVTLQTELGIDTENIRTRRAPIEIADHFFAPEEAEALNKIPAAQQRERFFQYWTLKESYMKAHGAGLSLGLDKFSFHFREDQSVLLKHALNKETDGSKWKFWQLKPTADYLVAVCARHALTHQGMGMLISRKTVPLAGDEFFECLAVQTLS